MMAKKRAKSGKRTPAKKSAAKKPAAKKSPARKPAKKSAKKSAKSPARKRAKKTATKSSAAPVAQHGWITHTDFTSQNPSAMQAWASKVLGWRFKPSMPMPDGEEYLMFAYSDMGGGGIGKVSSSAAAESVPYVHVNGVTRTFAKALAEGAEGIQPPHEIMPDFYLAIVRAPGGAVVGFAGA
jgi:hypothetical protein